VGASWPDSAQVPGRFVDNTGASEDFPSIPGERHDVNERTERKLLQEVRARMASGYYTSPRVILKTAENMLRRHSALFVAGNAEPSSKHPHAGN